MISSFFDVHVHMHTGVMWLSAFYGIVRIGTSTLRVPYGARVGNIRALADTLRFCEHPYANRPSSVVSVSAGYVRIFNHHTEPARDPQEP